MGLKINKLYNKHKKLLVYVLIPLFLSFFVAAVVLSEKHDDVVKARKPVANKVNTSLGKLMDTIDNKIYSKDTAYQIREDKEKLSSLENTDSIALQNNLSELLIKKDTSAKFTTRAEIEQNNTNQQLLKMAESQNRLLTAQPPIEQVNTQPVTAKGREVIENEDSLIQSYNLRQRNKPVRRSYGNEYEEIPVARHTKQANVSGFNTLDFETSDSKSFSETKSKTVNAVVYNSVTVKNGYRITFRTRDNVIVNGINLKKNSILFGAVKISAGRALCNISSVNINGTLRNMNIEVHDLDGQPGIMLNQDAINNEKLNDIAQKGESATSAAGINGSGIISTIAQLFMTNGEKKAFIPDGYKVLLNFK